MEIKKSTCIIVTIITLLLFGCVVFLAHLQDKKIDALNTLAENLKANSTIIDNIKAVNKASPTCQQKFASIENIIKKTSAAINQIKNNDALVNQINSDLTQLAKDATDIKVLIPKDHIESLTITPLETQEIKQYAESVKNNESAIRNHVEAAKKYSDMIFYLFIGSIISFIIALLNINSIRNWIAKAAVERADIEAKKVKDILDTQLKQTKDTFNEEAKNSKINLERDLETAKRDFKEELKQSKEAFDKEIKQKISTLENKLLEQIKNKYAVVEKRSNIALTKSLLHQGLFYYEKDLNNIDYTRAIDYTKKAYDLTKEMFGDSLQNIEDLRDKELVGVILGNLIYYQIEKNSIITKQNFAGINPDDKFLNDLWDDMAKNEYINNAGSIQFRFLTLKKPSEMVLSKHSNIKDKIYALLNKALFQSESCKINLPELVFLSETVIDIATELPLTSKLKVELVDDYLFALAYFSNHVETPKKERAKTILKEYSPVLISGKTRTEKEIQYLRTILDL